MNDSWQSKRVALASIVILACPALSLAQHPGPQPRPGPSIQTVSPDGITTFVTTPNGVLPVGQNELPYIESNLFDSNGDEMVNTLPSRPGSPFNLLDGPVLTSAISKTSPKDDLDQALTNVRNAAQKGQVDLRGIQFALNILEGNPLAGKLYSGFALLHYTGPERVKSVQPLLDAQGNTVGGNVDIHQIWYDNHIESDTILLDPRAVQNVPWTITYTIDVLSGGADDFAPFAMYFDAPPAGAAPGTFGPFGVAFDQTFTAMGEGKRYTIKVKQPPAKYWNLTYHWGWRIHPPRVQVTENALKVVGPMNLVAWETSTFGGAPRSSETAKLAAIAQIGELSPAKRIWQALKSSQTAAPSQIVALMNDARISFGDWSDRTHLPRGVTSDPAADVTLLFVNNTIYGNARTFNNWTGRGSIFKATLLNGDHFVHGYFNVDFGGARGWENQFQEAGGPGSSHTFGRDHFWLNAGGPWGAITVPPVAANGIPGLHKVEIQLNFDSPERVKLYQFDPFHHDVAVYTLH